MATPEEVPQILNIVDDYLRGCSSQSNTFGSLPTESLKLPWNQLDEKFNCEQVKRPDGCFDANILLLVPVPLCLSLF